ncbi:MULTISPECIES: polymorphic toxin-type HINT domain-containing protein [Cysteiniphilum]|uniref:polymorphic toxin-type HINT domain-containing protein n=1 Tax=Cysteiniphilum TaxID=2056696 RepID=UPI001787740C|nr:MULTISPECIES: polymorphic toxin-type HINT domain-containing protein [Cysteiniphilum]
MYIYTKSLRNTFLLGLFISSLSFIASAQAPSYDLISITPKTWQQVTLNYVDLIDGRSYLAEIKLLRPSKWLEENNIDQVGKRSIFSLPEFGIDQVEVTVTNITDTRVDTKDIDWRKEKTKTVTGTFKRYAKDVRTYGFKDENGNIEQINATSNHPFYVVNKQAYVAIDELTVSDELVSQLGKAVKLVCPVDKNSSCGERYNKNGKPVVVYNLEVYRDHVYYVGKGVLTHNVYTGSSSSSITSGYKKIGASDGAQALINAEPSYIDFADIDIARGYTLNSKGFIQRETMDYIYRADARSFDKIRSSGGFGGSRVFADGSMLDNGVDTLVGSRTAAGAYKFGLEEISGRFTVYRINVRGLTVASLNETVEHTNLFNRVLKENIFEGSYSFGWDEVHVKAPIGINRVSVVTVVNSRA